MKVPRGAVKGLPTRQMLPAQPDVEERAARLSSVLISCDANDLRICEAAPSIGMRVAQDDPQILERGKGART